MFANKRLTAVQVFFIFSIAFLLVPFAQSSFLAMMPGNLGDARLNNYFLENIYQFLAGHSASLWHLSFYSPFPYVLGFSDNLFGSSPVYLIARVLTGQSDTAFQIWYLFGYFANFYAAYYALNKLDNTQIAAVVGALIFAFALTVTAHSGHAQLHYRFGVPLSIAMYILFLDKKDWRHFVAATAWLVWQFYCTIYIGFFTLLMLTAISIVFVIHNFQTKKETPRHLIIKFFKNWQDQSPKARLKLFLSLLFLLFLLVLLFYPYLRVTQLYGASRTLEEISSMLPRPQSYFLSDGSWLWSSKSRVFDGIPMRHEHQMFIGAVPFLLAIIGFLFGNKNNNGVAYSLLTTSLASLMILTLFMGGVSLWFLFIKFPLASAIRAMTRIDLVLLFPAAYLAAVAIDYLCNRAQWASRLVLAIVIPVMIFEFSATTPVLSTKREWRERLSENESAFPKQLPPDSIVFFAQSAGPFYATELDAMWVAIKHGVRTINGYSGMPPPNVSMDYKNDCTELPKRILSYLKFIGHQDDKSAYLDLMRRVVPIGFTGCDDQWLKSIPEISTTSRIYSPEEIRKLSFQYIGKVKYDNQWVVTLKFANAGNLPISAVSSLGKTVRLSWRFVDSAGNPASGWDTRKDLPFDIQPHSSLNINIPIAPKMEIKSGTLQITLVQEMVFWAHDIGFEPLTVPWDK